MSLMSEEKTQSPNVSTSAGNDATTSLTVFRLSLLLIICVLVGAVAYALTMSQSRVFDAQRTMQQLGVAPPVQNRLDPRYLDSNEDLVADPSVATAQLIDPDPLVFSFIPTKNPKQYQAAFADLVKHLETQLGRQVVYRGFDSREAQLRAIRDGHVHIAGVNTGNVPIAVNASGFVPIATTGGERPGDSRYTMQIIVPADSDIRSINDLKNRTLTFTDPTSNSGFKAPYVILANDFGLMPQRDYAFRFSHSHERSIVGVAEGEFEAAAVASDMIKRLAAQGKYEPARVRVIYESEPFTPAAIGHVNNLKPELARQVQEALFSFKFDGTSLQMEFAPTNTSRFIPVNYKNDYALVRRIDDAVGREHRLE